MAGSSVSITQLHARFFFCSMFFFIDAANCVKNPAVSGTLASAPPLAAGRDHAAGASSYGGIGMSRFAMSSKDDSFAAGTEERSELRVWCVGEWCVVFLQLAKKEQGEGGPARMRAARTTCRRARREERQKSASHSRGCTQKTTQVAERRGKDREQEAGCKANQESESRRCADKVCGSLCVRREYFKLSGKQAPNSTISA